MFALIGGAMRGLAREPPRVRYLADASYWMYLAHLPLVFGLQLVILAWPIKFPLLIAW